MKVPERRRRPVKEIAPAPEGVDVDQVATRARYIGSPEHKDTPSFAGWPRPRADATICDRSFAGRQDELTGWLQAAIRRGITGGRWEGDFPKYAWFKDGDTVYVARLSNESKGEYKGWALRKDEWPKGIEKYYE